MNDSSYWSRSSLTLFALVGLGASIILGRLHHTNKALSKARDDLQRANDQLAAHADALAHANAELQQFAYTVAHDLNAPLRTITTRAEFCLERTATSMDNTTKESLAMVVTSAKQMQRLIHNLLTLARVGHDTSNAGTDFDLNDVAALALQNLRDDITATHATITIEPLPVVHANDDQFPRVLQNLLSNSIKYRSEHPPNVHVFATKEQDEWRVVITDNGIGIPPKYHSKLFQPFQRFHTVSDGSGLGLAICKRIIERHGGRIWAESDAGKGARFCFTIPAARIIRAPKAPEPMTAQPSVQKTAAT